MSLKATIDQDLKVALRTGDQATRDALRLLKSEVLNQEISLGLRGVGLEDSQVEQLIIKEAKKRREAVELYESAGRGELAQNELAELAILEKYLPKQLSDDEIIREIEVALADTEPVMANMGKVIGGVKSKLGSAADGATIARLVKERLS